MAEVAEEGALGGTATRRVVFDPVHPQSPNAITSVVTSTCLHRLTLVCIWPAVCMHWPRHDAMT